MQDQKEEKRLPQYVKIHDLLYDMDAAIKVWCRDTYGSNWYVFGQTAQNEARKNEAAEFIELADL